MADHLRAEPPVSANAMPEHERQETAMSTGMRSMRVRSRPWGWALVVCVLAWAPVGPTAWARPAPPAATEAASDAQEAPEDAVDDEAATGTGDAWLDTRLVDIDLYAARHRAVFADELVRYRDTPRALVEALLDRGRDDGWSPGDIYMACALAQVVGRPCRAVVERRDADRALPWSGLAEQLGAAPGSAPFQRIKRGVVESYRHWGRPLELDADLRAAADGA